MVKGLPGIGKTALAAHALRQWNGWNEDRKVIWCRCQSGMEIGELLSELASHCDPGHSDFLSELLQSEFDQHLLVSRFLASLEDVGIVTVLDDAYRLSGKKMETLLEESCRVFRQSALVLLGSQVAGLSPVVLSEIAVVRLQGLPKDEAEVLCARLFEAHGEQLPDTKIVKKAVSMTRGHPLFLRWLVGLALQERKTLSEVLSGKGIGELGSRLIEPLWESLSSREQKIMRFLAVLGGTAGRWLLQRCVDEATAAITRLSDRMLVDIDPYAGTVQLSLPVREFIFQRMAEEETDVFGEVGKKLIDVLKSGDHISTGYYALKAYRLLLASGETELAVTAAGLMAPFLFHKGRYSELATIPDELCLDAEELPPALATAVFRSLATIGQLVEAMDFFHRLPRKKWTMLERFHLILAVLDGAEPSHDLSEQLLNEADDILDTVKNPECRVRFFIARAVVLWREGDLPSAKKILGKALALAKRSSLQKMTGDVAQRLGMILVREGKLTAGLRVLRIAGEALRGKGRSSEHAALLGNRGTIHKELGNIEKAQEMFNKALAIRKSLGDRKGMSTVHNNLGLLLFQLRQLDEADRHLLVSLDCLEGMFDPLARATTLNNRTLVAAVRGQLEQAILLSEEAITLLGQAGHDQPKALCCTNLAIYKMMMGDDSGAQKARDAAEMIASRVSNPRLAGTVYQRLGQLYRLKGELDKAEQALTRGLEQLQGTEARKETAFIHTELAELALERGEPDVTMEWIDKAEISFPTKAFPWLSLTWLSLRAEAALVEGSSEAETLSRLLLDEAERYELMQFTAKGFMILREVKPEDYSDLSRQYSASRLQLNRQERFWVDDVERRLIQRAEQGKGSWAGAEYRIIEGIEPRPADKPEVTSLRKKAARYELWLDVEKKICHEKKLGDVPLFRKRVLAPLLLFFMRNPNKRCPAETVFEKVWGVAASPTDRATFMVNLTRLRQLIEPDPENPRYILTVSGLDGRAEYYFNSKTKSCLIEPLT
ncbi:MAG: tetratricopeptide repeat protein [bacterium]|nr:tetratricopeptide repeat protein [bacterium]